MENLDTDISVWRVKKKKQKVNSLNISTKKQDTDHSEAPEVILS